MNGNESLVVLKSYDNPVQAEIAKSILDSAGIFCALHGEYMSTIYTPIAFPARLMVRTEDFDEAQNLLRTECY
ncbi:MAG: DUF2007 domain-containing protein [Alistipes sp.]|jgi:hypothetical protein|nr:DUF2007 domain-containing protein [Alistipes sp.]